VGEVTTEGDELYYEVHGQERRLLMIAGGLGEAGIYAFVAGSVGYRWRCSGCGYHPPGLEIFEGGKGESWLTLRKIPKGESLVDSFYEIT